MIIKDLIKNKDYDYISWRCTPPEGWGEDSIFIGACKSENGVLIPLDGDIYSDEEEVLSYEEWSQDDIKNGLTIIVKGVWYTSEEIGREKAKFKALRNYMTLEEAVVFCEEHDCDECPVVLDGIDTRTIKEKLGGKLCCENLVR